jgi:hypothetical protein
MIIYIAITAMIAILITAYAIILGQLYKHYRKCGMTRKQAFWATWRMIDE